MGPALGGWSASLSRRIAHATRRVFRRQSVEQGQAIEGLMDERTAVRHQDPHDVLVSSNLFDTRFYAAQAGIEADLDECVVHYLQRGAAAGYSPNRLFDGDAYLALYPDVSAAHQAPFLHFVAFGLSEGRRTEVPEGCLTELGAIEPATLASRRISEQALALGWSRNSPCVWTSRPVAVYASSLGNFFFRHIADRIAEGLRRNGVTVYRLDQNSSKPPDAVVDFVVAPHEFFHLGAGVLWHDRLRAASGILLNTEQP